MMKRANFNANKLIKLFNGSGSGGRISWDRNSIFSWDQIFDHEIEFQFVHEVEFS